MAIALVSALSPAKENLASGLVTTSAAIDTTGANFLVVCITSSVGSTFFGSLTDSKTNTWSVAQDWINNTGGYVRIMYAVNPTVGTGHTFTVTYSAGSPPYIVLAVASYSGMQTASVLDQTATGSGTSASLATSSTGTTTVADELLIMTGTVSNGSNSTFTGTNGFTVRSQYGRADLGEIGFLADRIVSATGTYAGTATWGGSSGAFIAALATFKGVSTGVELLPKMMQRTNTLLRM